jgi:TPP-dependent indolepyruvate ferredoxin oxidoreductase alpha subunit
VDVCHQEVILGIEDETAQQLGLRVYQVGMIWPLEPQGVREFAEGLQEPLPLAAIPIRAFSQGHVTVLILLARA